VFEFSLDVEFDSLTRCQIRHLDENLVKLVRLVLERDGRDHLDVQVLTLNSAQDVIDQFVEDSFWKIRKKSIITYSLRDIREKYKVRFV
jgi:hypothetical protein